MKSIYGHCCTRLPLAPTRSSITGFGVTPLGGATWLKTSAAHILTVTASGLGGWIYGWCRDYYGSYNPVMYAIAGLTLVNAIVMFAVKVPAERQAEPGSG